MFEQEDSRVGTLQPVTENGITHVYVTDLGKGYELINGEWVETAPF